MNAYPQRLFRVGGIAGDQAVADSCAFGRLTHLDLSPAPPHTWNTSSDPHTLGTVSFAIAFPSRSEFWSSWI